MSDDILNRLRSARDDSMSLFREAALEIERLRWELDQLTDENDADGGCFNRWVWRGIDEGWAKPFCAQHDPLPILTLHESDEMELGLDPCFPSLRVLFPPKDDAL